MSGGNAGVLGGEMRGVLSFSIVFLMMLSAATMRCTGTG